MQEEIRESSENTMELDFRKLAVSILFIFSISLIFSSVQAGTFKLTLHEDWNAISSPFEEGINLDRLDSKCGISSYIHWYNTSKGGYDYFRVSEREKLKPGKGYWVYSYENCSLYLNGTSYSLEPIDVEKGKQYFIGAPYKEKTLSELKGTCSLDKISLKKSVSYGEYKEVNRTKPGKGYWIETNQTCTFNGEEEKTCKDSDGGINYGTPGIVEQCSYGDTSYCTSVSDRCMDEDTLIEYYCSGDSIASTTHNCSFGCEGGACMEGRKPPCDSYGDVNLDGYVTSEDKWMVWNATMGNIDLSKEQKKRADVNGDGLNSYDSKLIDDYVKGQIDTFKVCSSQISVKFRKPIYSLGDGPGEDVLRVEMVNDGNKTIELGNYALYISGNGETASGFGEEKFEPREIKKIREHGTASGPLFTKEHCGNEVELGLSRAGGPIEPVNGTLNKVRLKCGFKAPCNSYGDVDFDGYVTTSDSKAVANNVGEGANQWPREKKERADVNDNGRVDFDDSVDINQYALGNRSSFKVCTLSCEKLFYKSKGAIRVADTDFNGKLSGFEAESLDPDYWDKQDRENALKFSEENCSFEVWNCREVKNKFEDTVRKRDLDGNGKLNKTEVLLAGKDLGGEITDLEYAGLWNFQFNNCSLVEGREPPCQIYGDVNGDRVITLKDKDLLIENLDNEKWGLWKLSRSDVNNNGKISKKDAKLIARFYSDLENSFPVCEETCESLFKKREGLIRLIDSDDSGKVGRREAESGFKNGYRKGLFTLPEALDLAAYSGKDNEGIEANKTVKEKPDTGVYNKTEQEKTKIQVGEVEQETQDQITGGSGGQAEEKQFSGKDCKFKVLSCEEIENNYPEVIKLYESINESQILERWKEGEITDLEIGIIARYINARCEMEEFTLNLEKGWNPVSSPFKRGIRSWELRRNCDVQDEVHFWNSSKGGYETRTLDRTSQTFDYIYSLEPGRGYWVNSNDKCSLKLEGIPYTMNPLKVKSGEQYFIGAPYKETKVSQLKGNCDLNKLTVKYGESKGDYHEVKEMEPGKAYWVESNESCTFALGKDNRGPEIRDIKNLPQSPVVNDTVKVVATAEDGISNVKKCSLTHEYKNSRSDYMLMKPYDGSYDEKEELVSYKLSRMGKGIHNVTLKCSDPKDNSNKENYSFYVSSESCGETDNGNDPETPGSVSYKENYNDSCSNGNLTEYYCSSKGVKKKEYNCSTYCKKENGVNYKGTCSVDSRMGYCECEKEVEKNIKDMDKYSEKQAFMVSDQNWKRALSLVPVTTWTQQEGVDQECQRGYQTAEGVCSYPNLIYHREGEAFDADSVVYFLQQYTPGSLKLVGNTPDNLDNLLVAEPSFGAGLKDSMIKRINKENYLGYWDSFKDVVYVSDSYEDGLIASTYASLINAPLLIEGYNDDLNLNNKNVICVERSGKRCDESLSEEQVQRKYFGQTSTDKFVLTNPQDLDISVNEGTLSPEKSNNPVSNLYSRQSLSSPSLAAAKHELLLTTESPDQKQAFKLVQEKSKRFLNIPDTEPTVDLEPHLDKENFKFYTEKNEAGLNITIQFLRDYQNYETMEFDVENIYLDESCFGKNITLKTEKGKKEINVMTASGARSVPYYEKGFDIPSDLLPDKKKFNITLKGECNSILILNRDKPILTETPEGYRYEDEAGNTVGIYNKQIKQKEFVGIGPESHLEFEVDLEDSFSYNFSESISYLAGIEKANLAREEEDNKGTVSIHNGWDTFYELENEPRLIPHLKKRAFLTVIASPKSISFSEVDYEWGSYTFRDSLDTNLYADLYNNSFMDLRTGRLMGLTTSDVSGYIARDLFYDELPVQNKALLMVKSADSEYDADKLKRGFAEVWTEEMKDQFQSYTECYSYNDPDLGCETNAAEMREAYNSSELIFFADHGWTEGLGGVIRTNQLPRLVPSVQIADACLTCSFADSYEKQDLFCANNLRKGSMGFIGAVSVSWGVTTIHENKTIVAETNRKFIQDLFLENKKLGSAFKQNYPQGSGPYTLLGDPLFEVES